MCLGEARLLVVLVPGGRGVRYRDRKFLWQFVGLFGDAHARTPALLPVAASRVVKASEKSFTPSTRSLSVTSFMEIPALASSAMVFAAPSTFSVRLGRSCP